MDDNILYSYDAFSSASPFDSGKLKYLTVPFVMKGFFTFNSNIYHLKTELSFIITKKDKYLYAYNDYLGTHIDADNFSKLKMSIKEELDFLWRNYVMEEDSNMTGDAIFLKKKILNVLEEKNSVFVSSR